MRRGVAVAVVALALAVGLAWWLAPDRGGVLASPRPAPARPVVPPAPAAPPVPAPGWEERIPPPAPVARQENPAVLRNGAYVGTTEAVGAALVERRVALAACWRAFEERAGPDDERLDTRFMVQLTVSAEEDGTGRVETFVPNADDALLEECVAGALADARFWAPPHGGVSLAWPVPVDVGTR